MKKHLGLLAFCIFCSASLFAQPSLKKLDVIAYYTGNGEDIKKYPVDKLTQIIYSFLHLKNDTIAFDRDEQKTTLLQLVALKKTHPSLKIMVSLGGWGGCEPCSLVFANVESRKNFAASVLKLMKEYDADGIDLDWEYPAIVGHPGHAWMPADRDNFTQLIKELHRVLSPKYELSFAAGGFTEYLEKSVDWDAVFPLVNRVNLMTYDLINGYSKKTGHHTALYSQPRQKESTDNCVQWLLKKGYPAEKLVIGGAFYARVWENVTATDNGLYQVGRFKEGVDFKNFNTKLSADSGWVKYWDETSKAAFAYNAGRQWFATYDNERSLAEKVHYAQQLGLGGIMFWELVNDKYSNGLLEAISQAVKK